MNIPSLVKENPVLVDRRLIGMRSCSSATEAYVPTNIEEHKARCKFVKDRILLSAGLKPAFDLPEREVSVSRERIYEGVRIYDVYSQVLPGLKLTGNLFLPEKSSGKLPGVLCPHGHWDNGRVHHSETGGVVMRCFQLARLGFAVFAYDMIGYNDNNEITHWWKYDERRYYDLFGISTFSMQTINSLVALDFLCSHSEVDEARIACTGASGGASQTWFLAALDERIKVLAPVCMLSSHFQGGCSCEEGPLLRVTGLTSFDIVSSVAPRPIMLPSVTGDWTNLNQQYEIPRLREVYKLFSASERIESFHYEDVHNYNRRTREHIYAFLVRQLMGKDCGEIIKEEDIPPPPPELLWHCGVKPTPPSEVSMKNALEKQKSFFLENTMLQNSCQKEKQELFRQLLDDARPKAKDVVARGWGPEKGWGIENARVRPYSISRRGVGDYLTSIDIYPNNVKNPLEIDVVVAEGEYFDYFGNGAKADVVKKALSDGRNIRIAELLGSGSNKWQMKYAIREGNLKEGPENHSNAFEESLFTMRVHDIITNIVQLKEQGYKCIRVIATGNAAPVALAAAQLEDFCLDVNLTGVDDSTWETELNYQPLIMRLGGLATLTTQN